MRLHVRLALWTGGLLVIAAAALAFWITRIAGRYQAEVAQRLNANVAMYVTGELALFDSEGVNEGALQELAHRVMTVNPSAEVYLLDADGSIIATLVPPERLRRTHVDLRPIRTFLGGTPTRLIAGDDPTTLEHRAPFSVAPVSSASPHAGYLYVVLGGERYDSAAAALRGSYALKTGLVIVVFILLLTLCVGAGLFYGLTLPLRALMRRVQSWAAGIAEDAGAGERAAADNDELRALAAQFDLMARQIERQVQLIGARDRERRELIETISHDLRTPLASLHGYLETVLLKEATLSRSSRRQYLSVALRHSQRVERLIAALFELSKLDANATVPAPETFSIAELMQDVVQRFRLRARQLGIGLSARADPAAPSVRADLALIERVFENLLDNALRHTPAGGQIEIHAEVRDAFAQVTVADNGAGIAPADLPRVFERHFRRRDRENEAGSGLGLAIVRRIIELHGGSVAITSAPGLRTAVTFSLPLAALAGSAAAQAALEAPRSSR